MNVRNAYRPVLLKLLLAEIFGLMSHVSFVSTLPSAMSTSVRIERVWIPYSVVCVFMYVRMVKHDLIGETILETSDIVSVLESSSYLQKCEMTV